MLGCWAYAKPEGFAEDEQKAKLAEQPGTWAANSNENRVAISEGGADALVALVVTGSDLLPSHVAKTHRFDGGPVEQRLGPVYILSWG